jgi:hypothetical protein
VFSNVLPSRYTVGLATVALLLRLRILMPAAAATGSAPAVAVLNSGPTMILAPSATAWLAAALPPSVVPPSG